MCDLGNVAWPSQPQHPAMSNGTYRLSASKPTSVAAEEMALFEGLLPPRCSALSEAGRTFSKMPAPGLSASTTTHDCHTRFSHTRVSERHPSPSSCRPHDKAPTSHSTARAILGLTPFVSSP
ncbi:hypothetical protein mRhiFer1_008338 [Rhinolophus ferrumequinum]|uniref:Uncharacterized protein n=1 Tax=Rhinolophus ferrumequinum TaxID=59479 RepID=A0A7J7VDT3_RHIFE|nr:hypothetical protein mRhiFer1_008338 [Rhinolophus ferrumequinum]